MCIQTDGACTIAELYAKRDSIGLPQSVCKQPTRNPYCLKAARELQARYVYTLGLDVEVPPRVFIYEPLSDSGRAAILDGRQRLKAIFSCLDGNFALKKFAPGDLFGADYIRLLTTIPNLSDALMRTTCTISTINATHYWEAAIAAYPQICGHAHKTVLKEQEMLMRHLDMEDDIFTDEDYCDWRVSNLKMGIEKFKRKPPLSSHEYLKSEGWQKVKAMKSELRATEFVARHHRRGAIPC